MKLMTGHKVTAGKVVGDNVEITVEPVKGGEPLKLSACHVLISTGRRPYTEGLNLSAVGLKTDQKGRIVINEHLQTAVKNIYAIGDVVAGPMLAHKAEQEGIAAVEHLSGKGGHVNYDAIPSVVYTSPEVAWVGRTEEELKKAGV